MTLMFNDTVGLLIDGSMLNFYDDGKVEFFPNLKFWRKSSSGFYKYENKKQAIDVWNVINELIKE